MSDDYRRDTSNTIKEVNWTVRKTLPLIILVCVILFGLSSLIRVGGKMVDRQIMVSSHQYKEGMNQRAATLQASIAEIDVMLMQGKGNADELEGQKMILNAQIKSITKIGK